MNIKRAKEEIKNTIRAYLKKDACGEYEIPVLRQRPLLLMGPSGIGKTAIIEQAARECGVGLVSYTITHHTRQSAVGLPFIREKNYGGEICSVTEYTMSEIIASVYDKMEVSGLREGILFLDEINCVSETLAPTMLEFLQCKRFGNVDVPKGWIIVAAGNPPEYNKSVKEFDIVTLDRVRKIDVEEDYGVWREYALTRSVDETILSYLEIRKENFYSFKTDAYGKRFVTARGWEDLSGLIKVYEELSIPIDRNVVEQYVQDKKIAEDFSDYYELYQKYRKDYRTDEILAGVIRDGVLPRLAEAPFDERLSVTGLLLGSLHTEFAEYKKIDLLTGRIYDALKRLKEMLFTEDRSFDGAMEELITDAEEELKRKKAASLLTREEEHELLRTAKRLASIRVWVKMSGAHTREECFDAVKARFSEMTANRQEQIEETGKKLSNAFTFLLKAFGLGQELVVFLTGLTTDGYGAKFISDNGCEEYYQYSGELMFHERQEELQKEIGEIRNAGKG